MHVFVKTRLQMGIYLIAILFFSLSAIAEDSPQKIILNTPVMVENGATELVIKSVTLNWQHPSIEIHLGEPGNNGIDYPTITYKNGEALTMLNQMNTMNYASNSFCKKILQKLITDGYIPTGTITTP